MTTRISFIPKREYESVWDLSERYHGRIIGVPRIPCQGETVSCAACCTYPSSGMFDVERKHVLGELRARTERFYGIFGDVSCITKEGCRRYMLEEFRDKNEVNDMLFCVWIGLLNDAGEDERIGCLLHPEFLGTDGAREIRNEFGHPPSIGSSGKMCNTLKACGFSTMYRRMDAEHRALHAILTHGIHDWYFYGRPELRDFFACLLVSDGYGLDRDDSYRGIAEQLRGDDRAEIPFDLDDGLPDIMEEIGSKGMESAPRIASDRTGHFLSMRHLVK